MPKSKVGKKEKEKCENCNGSGWVEPGEVACPVCQNVGYSGVVKEIEENEEVASEVKPEGEKE